MAADPVAIRGSVARPRRQGGDRLSRLVLTTLAATLAITVAGCSACALGGARGAAVAIGIVGEFVLVAALLVTLGALAGRQAADARRGAAPDDDRPSQAEGPPGPEAYSSSVPASR